MIRSRKMLNAAAGETCARCGADDGTIVAAHYTGLRQHIYGKGKGIKCHDPCSAHLCRTCHEYFDEPTERKSIARSEEFLHCIMLTMIRLFNNGTIAPR